MIERKVWWNGKIIDESEARLSIYDSALMFGDCVFEMTRSFNKKQFKLREHLERLMNGCKIYRIPLKYSIEEIEKACELIQIANEINFEKDDEHRLMINVTRGLLGIYDGNVNVQRGTNLIIADFPLRWTTRGMTKYFNEGVPMVITPQQSIPARYLDPKIKSRSRVHYQMANIQASLYKDIAGKAPWALLTDENGYITEGTGDNFFIVKDGKVITPKGENVLRGISREYVKTLCNNSCLQYIEKDISSYDVYTAQEAFITGTPFCMLPVTSLDGIKIGTGKVDEVYHMLLKWWTESSECQVDIKAQIELWDSRFNKFASDAPTPYNFGRNK